MYNPNYTDSMDSSSVYTPNLTTMSSVQNQNFYPSAYHPTNDNYNDYQYQTQQQSPILMDLSNAHTANYNNGNTNTTYVNNSSDDHVQSFLDLSLNPLSKHNETPIENIESIPSTEKTSKLKIQLQIVLK